ncbi:hypothetical protein Y032_0108g28 [Ancylostoma ceylanicum]|nr:hypothetical protein Y032_0108g28 [Ancylostoma ceylanicum]
MGHDKLNNRDGTMDTTHSCANDEQTDGVTCCTKLALHMLFLIIFLILQPAQVYSQGTLGQILGIRCGVEEGD